MPKTNKKTRIICYIMIVLNILALFYLFGVPKSMTSRHHFTELTLMPNFHSIELTTDVYARSADDTILLESGTFCLSFGSADPETHMAGAFYTSDDQFYDFSISEDDYIDHSHETIAEIKEENRMKLSNGTARYYRYLRHADYFFLHPGEFGNDFGTGIIGATFVGCIIVLIYLRRRSDIIFITLSCASLALEIFASYEALTHRVFCL